MKIKTITCHDVYNYGASLQAYALQSFLLQQGHDVEIIDYKPDYICRKYNFWYIYTSNPIARVCSKNIILKFLYCLLYAPVRYKTWRRISAFDKFIKQYLHLTKRYVYLQQLQSDSPEAECYISGSDQVWNTSLPNGKDNAFFLDFGDRDVKRISYAASFGVTEISDKQRIKKLLQNFNYISVRESTGINIIEQLGLSAVQVLDPVFLLSKDQWIAIVKESFTKHINYLLIYDIFCKDKSIKKYACQIANKYDLRLLAINDNKKVSYAENLVGTGPIEFVKYISNAKFVVCNSFHATAFALIFHIPFIVIYNKSNSSRMLDILKYVKLNDCFNPDESNIFNINYDWDKVDKLLNIQRQNSISYLNNVL